MLKQLYKYIAFKKVVQEIQEIQENSRKQRKTSEIEMEDTKWIHMELLEIRNIKYEMKK